MASLERRVAIDAARAAGHLLKSELPGSRHIAYKGSPTNLVTEMDTRAEELIVGRLAAAFPDDAVLGEERGAAGSLLVEEAGGRVTNLKGGALDLDAPALVASNGRIHSAIVDVLRSIRDGGPT
jgi:fructose-1,6-bisphosphatase/inositol monophosphatase family enzyme